jgi:hypothetical protein
MNRVDGSWKADPRRSAVPALKKEQPCVACGDQIAVGEPAIQEVRRKQGVEKKSKQRQKKMRVFVYYHRRCVPKKETKVTENRDIFLRSRRLPGSFESGKGR